MAVDSGSTQGVTSGDSSPTVVAPTAESLVAKYAHLVGGSGAPEAGGDQEGEDGNQADASGVESPDPESPLASKTVPYDVFQKSRTALRTVRDSAARLEAENNLLRQQFEGLQALVERGVPGSQASPEADDTDPFADPEVEALKSALRRLEQAESTRTAQAMASQMEVEWQQALVQNPQIAGAGDLIMSLLRADANLTVAQAAAQVARYIPATAPAKIPVTPTKPAPAPIRPLPSNGGGTTTPALAAPKSFSDVSKAILARMANQK